MPEQRGNIAEFNAGNQGIDTSKLGQAAEEVSSAGYLEGKLYRQAGEDIKQGAHDLGAAVENHEYMTELTQGSAVWSATYNNQTAAWQKMQASADPNDATIQKKFMDESLEPALQQFQGGFTTEQGQKWALDQANMMRREFNNRTNADMMTRAGEAKMEDFKTSLNQAGATVYKDPTALGTAFDHADSVLSEIKNSGQFDADQIAKMNTMEFDWKNELSKTAVKGLADRENDPNGPAKAKALLASGQLDKWIPPNEKEQLDNYANGQASAWQTRKDQEAAAKQYKDEQVNAQESKSVFSALASGQGYPATVALSNTKLSPDQRSNLVANKNGILSLPPKFLQSPEYGNNFSQVASAVYNGQAVTSSGLFDGVRRQELTPAGAVQIQNLQEKMKTAQGMAEVRAQGQVVADMEKQMVKGGAIANDPVGRKQFNSMLNSFYPAWDAAIASGKTPAELSNPESKDYMGNFASTFKRSDAQALADVTAAKPASHWWSNLFSSEKSPVPPPEKREVGKMYPTPRGDATWTGTGWKLPEAAPKPE